jgi:hypothetical protein
MICRIWHGWTTPQNADAYERLLRSEIFPGIAVRATDGYQGIQLLRRGDGDGVELPPKARALLERFDARSAHYDVRRPRGTG